MDYPVEIIKALHQVMENVGYVQKKDKNAFHKYSYASEAALLEVLRPAMLEAGLVLIPSGQSLSPADSNGNTQVAMSYTLTHISGAVWPKDLVAYGCGNDRSSKGTVGDKGAYKAITGANKYLLFKLFQIETGDDPEVANRSEKEPPKDKQYKEDIPIGQTGFISASNVDMLKRVAKKATLSETELDSYLKENHDIESVDRVTLPAFSVILNELKKLPS